MLSAILLLLFALRPALADQLVQAQILYRHGARYQSEKNWNWQPYAQYLSYLSPVGMRQHYVLGDWIRTRYVHTLKLLSPHYDENQIHVRSADKNR